MKKFLLISLFVVFGNLLFAQGVLLKAGEQYIGAKIALGGVAGASYGLIGNYEYGYQDNIGLGATVAYSGYSEDLFGGTWSYTNILILANVGYHYDLLHNEKLDTWGAFNIGYNVASAKWEWKTKPPFAIDPTVSVGGVVWGFSANARYFLTDKLAATASVGYGLGYLNIGLDYKL